MFKFSQASIDTLKGVHADLVNVMMHAIQVSLIDFKIVQGLRTKAYQEALYAQGREILATVNAKRRAVGLPTITDTENQHKVTWTLKSRHISGCAVDVAVIVNGKVSWDPKYYHELATVIKDCAQHFGVHLHWGPDIGIKGDLGHYELDSKEYP